MRKVLGPQMPRQKPPKSPQVPHMRAKRVTEPALCVLAIRLQTGSTNQRHAAERPSGMGGVEPPPSTWSTDPDLGDNREETDEDGNVRIAFFDTGRKSGVKLYSTVGAWLARQRFMRAGGSRLDAEYEAEEWNRTNKVYEDRRPQGPKDECGRPTKAPQGACTVVPVVLAVFAVVSQPVRCTPTCALQPA